MYVSGTIGAEKRYWPRLCHEDSTKSGYVRKRAGMLKNSMMKVYKLVMKFSHYFLPTPSPVLLFFHSPSPFAYHHRSSSSFQTYQESKLNSLINSPLPPGCSCKSWARCPSRSWPPVGRQDVLFVSRSGQSLSRHGVPSRRWVYCFGLSSKVNTLLVDNKMPWFSAYQTF